jgi:TDG/mug DNA glycosylase family protein
MRPDRKQLQNARGAKVADVIAPGLEVLFVGINPSLYSAAVGHHFARPGNRFWRTLHQSGFTPRQLAPERDRDLLALGIGLTNVVDRATARADELEVEELRKGARVLARKLQRTKPKVVAMVGITAYRVAFERPRAAMGPQEHVLGGARVWVLPNPSGLNAHYQIPDLVRLYRRLRRSLR